mmetsp:Transcript_128061/g.190823  ORF Transcript_128061/g.190823 Transcript_128061/m.190823 type:complete len:258 (+) Transcript_128061:51-824(+)
MGWYNDPSFNWDDFNGGSAPACSIKRSAAGEAGAAAAPAPPPAPAAATVAPSGNTACPLPSDATPPPPPPDVDYIYHLCQKSKWMEAKARKQPYFPPTYIADGKFTRMTVHKDDLVSTANEYYKAVPGSWIVLEIDCATLYSFGIAILAQDAPESSKKGQEEKQPVKCLQVYGGISTSLPGLVANVYRMKRDEDGTFLSISESSTTSSSAVKKAAGDEKKDEIGDSKPIAKKKEQAPSPPTKEKKGGFFSKLTKSKK